MTTHDPASDDWRRRSARADASVGPARPGAIGFAPDVAAPVYPEPRRPVASRPIAPEPVVHEPEPVVDAYADPAREGAREEAIEHRPAGEQHVVAGNRSLADFERARRHSRIVSLLKVGLPAGGALTIVAIVSVLLFAGSHLPSINIGRTKIEDGKLVMDNPQINGTDANRRPYKLTARRAVQDADHPTHITLEEINARLPMNDRSFARLTAGNGVYDADGKTLRLGGAVAVNTEDGMTIKLEDANIDIAGGTLQTDKPVSVDTGRAFVSADTLAIEDKGNRIIFNNRVRMTIRPQARAEAANTGLRNILLRPVQDPAATRLKAATQ